MPVDPASLVELLSRLRKRCPGPRWTAAVDLAARGAVLLQRETDDEAMLVVQVPDWPSGYTAVLYPTEEEWGCDCGGADPCAHVVAAALALQKAHEGGDVLKAVSAVQARLRYELRGSREGLLVTRSIVGTDGSATRLQGSLADTTAVLAPGEGDWAVDRLLSPDPTRLVGPDRTAALIAALAHCDDIRCDGRTVTARDEPVTPHAVLDDHPAGFYLRLERDPTVTDVVAPGVVRCDAVLRPVGTLDLSGHSLERLPRTRTFAAREVEDLVLSVLPDLAARIPVEIRARKLPAVARGIPPRVDMEFTLVDHLLAVVPTVVYGDPPCARIVAGKLVHLRGPVPVRDTDAEVTLAHRLLDELNMVPGVRADFRGTEAPRFVARLKAWSHGGDAASTLFGSTPLVPRLTVRETGFDLSFDLPPGDHAEPGDPPRRATAATVLQVWREGLDVVPVEGGGWAPLPAAWLQAHGHQVADLLAARRDDGSVPRSALPALAGFCEALEHPAPPSLAGLASLAWDAGGIPAATLPADLTATLRPYQVRGVDWLCALRDAGLGAVLADDMGLGKTLQAMCALKGRCLVVAPRSVVHNWVEELTRFRPGLQVGVYHGPARRLDPADQVTVTTYAVLRLDAAALAAVPWDAVVLDEAQAIKNPDSQAARAAYGLRGDFRVALSGTPVENRLEELWSLMHFTNPGLLGGRGDFETRYAGPASQGDRAATDRLRQRIRPFVLRRLKRVVAPELPPRTESVLRCDLDDHERSVYDAVRAATQRDVVRSLREGGNTLAALEALLRLRQAACHAALVPGQTATHSSKLASLMDALESAAADGHKALVFSQWTSLLDLTEPHLNEAGIPFVRLDGSTRDRGAVVAEFQSEGGPAVMLVSLKAGGTGLNLTAADHVFLLDPWWNPAVEDQAADRAHRIGQQRPVMIYRLVAADTVEERILALQGRKRALAQATLDGGDPTAGLTREDLLALLD